MTAIRTPKLLLFAALALASCNPNGDLADPEDSEAPLSDLDSLLDGAPTNDELPEDGKFDAVYPAQFDVVDTQSPMQSQGSRGVCSIFSTVALMEHLYIKEGTLPNPDFSEQFLQWSTKVELRAFQHTGGSSANQNLRAINQFGIVTEADEPYQTQPWGTSDDEACTGDDRPVRCYTNGDPSETALAANRWKLPRGRYVNSRERSIKAFMTENDAAVIAGMTFFYQSWNHRKSELKVNKTYWNEGYVLAPNEEDKELSLAKRAGHSILLVGWDDDLEVPKVDENGDEVKDEDGNVVMEKGFWLFKNSWGTGGFGVDNPHGEGYGWLSMDYVSEYASVYGSGNPELNLVETCDDGQDNDFNGSVDCEDDGCSDNEACQVGGLDFSNDSATAIPDNDAAGATSVIAVAQPGSAGLVTVSVDITHPYIGDLTVALTSPTGTIVTLHDKSGSSNDDITKTWTLTDYVGEEVTGDWSLSLVDGGARDEGTLNNWSLSLQLGGALPDEDCSDDLDNDADGLTDCADADCSGASGCEDAVRLTGTADTAVQIPDNDSNGVTTTVSISQSASVTSLVVDVDITHTYRGDLIVVLNHPGGESVTLHNQEGDDADNLIRSYTPPEFAGLATAGDWTLTVSDNANNDTGVLNSWALTIEAQ